MSPPRRHRLLLVEDSLLVALDLRMLLDSGGYDVSGPYPSMQSALPTLDRGPIDAALLDIDVRDGLVFPLADALAARRIPVVFVTGHSTWVLPSQHGHRPVVTKPYRPEELLAAVADTIRAGSRDAGGR